MLIDKRTNKTIKETNGRNKLQLCYCMPIKPIRSRISTSCWKIPFGNAEKGIWKTNLFNEEKDLLDIDVARSFACRILVFRYDKDKYEKGREQQENYDYYWIDHLTDTSSTDFTNHWIDSNTFPYLSLNKQAIKENQILPFFSFLSLKQLM